MMSPAWKRSNNSRSRAISPVSLPAYGPIARSLTMAVASDNSTTTRAMGKPRPGFCVVGCGYSAWFAVVSGMLMVLPSTQVNVCRPLSKATHIRHLLLAAVGGDLRLVKRRMIGTPGNLARSLRQ